jgi:predicted RNase H-like nuclease (RuvC/YqgF family)
MSMLDQFQILDDLIFKLTVPPIRTELRNQLGLTRGQVMAYQAASDKQDQTLARQAEAIDALEKKNAELEAKTAKLKAQNSEMKPQLARAKKIPEMKDENRLLTAELAKERAKVKRLEAEIKLRDEGTEPGFSVMS